MIEMDFVKSVIEFVAAVLALSVVIIPLFKKSSNYALRNFFYPLNEISLCGRRINTRRVSGRYSAYKFYALWARSYAAYEVTNG